MLADLNNKYLRYNIMDTLTCFSTIFLQRESNLDLSLLPWVSKPFQDEADLLLRENLFDWLFFRFNSPMRQYFSLHPAICQIEGGIKQERIDL